MSTPHRDIPEEMVETVARAFAEEEAERDGVELFRITDHHRTVARDVLSDALAGRTVVELPEPTSQDSWLNWRRTS